mmetsp:Transcript_93099/g.221428  ORF Transcript_93099/g.221428 Transcript_93099/m.221428 type:complete len:437 (-) Transcript_93099:94-1404(-)
MLRLALLAFLVPALGQDATCEDASCKKKSRNGLALLQGSHRRGRTQGMAQDMEADAEARWCAAEGQDPYWPNQRSCCPGLARCGPYRMAWGGHSYLCQSNCQQPLDACGCAWPEGWSSTSRTCRYGSSTESWEADLCRSQTTQAPVTTETTTETETTSTEAETTRTETTTSMISTSESTTVSSASTTASSESTTVTTETTTGGATGETPTELRIMSWNVYFGNSKFGAMADMMKKYDIDIANLQETNNKLEKIAEASGYVSANTWERTHDWCGYNFYKPGWGSSWSVEIDVPGSRGVCGAMIQKGAAKFCVWGLHPIQNNNNVRFAKESVQTAAEKMKECSEQFNAPSIFLGDFNTGDWKGVQNELQAQTGWSWTLGAKHDIDFIFIQTGPLKVGQVSYSQIVGDGTCWPAFPPHNRVSPECGYADHSPLWAVITL